jgi:NAD(P)-dependent dehydrogenase (short-subunit alcohol dehydrogenase family)
MLSWLNKGDSLASNCLEWVYTGERTGRVQTLPTGRPLCRSQRRHVVRRQEEAQRGRFKGKVAVVTGGASGLGRASAIRLAAEDACVTIADIDAVRGPAVCDEIDAASGRALFVHADVTREADSRRMAAETTREYGRLDVLLTCAGVGSSGTVVDTDEAYWDQVLDLDLKGVYLASKYAIPAMIEGGGGAIVHIASIGGLRGDWGGASFSAAKGGVINLTRHMAVAHAADSVRVNCICPGVIRTPLTADWLSDPAVWSNVIERHPIGRIGTPEDVAAAVAFLASDEASFITGAILAVDGGSLAKGR